MCFVLVYILLGGMGYILRCPGFFQAIFGAFVKGPAAKAAAGRYPKRATP